MAKHGKKYMAALAKVNVDTIYSPKEAVSLAKETSYAKFDASIEVHMRMGLDPRQADQQVRDVVVLPNGLGKTVRVLVFAQGEGATKAQEGGADYVADTDDMINKIAAGWTDFDVTIATPDMMAVRALEILREYKIIELPVCDEYHHPIGMIHLHDITRAGIS